MKRVCNECANRKNCPYGYEKWGYYNHRACLSFVMLFPMFHGVVFENKNYPIKEEI